MTEPSKDETPAEPVEANPPTTEMDLSQLRPPTNEGSPIGDALKEELAAPASAPPVAASSAAPETPDEDDEDDEIDIDFGDEIPFEAKPVKRDVKRALERETQDGKGDDEVPESDWDSFATKNVEVQD